MSLGSLCLLQDGKVYNDIRESQWTCQEYVSNLTPTVRQVLHTMRKIDTFQLDVMHSNAETNDLSACVWMAMCVSIQSDRRRLIRLCTSWTTNWELRKFWYYMHKTTDAQYSKHQAQKENKPKVQNICDIVFITDYHLTKCSAVNVNNPMAVKS